MKFLIVLVLALASASAFNLSSKKIISCDRFMPVVGRAVRIERERLKRVQPVTIGVRIAGGEDAEISEFGYQVGIALQAQPTDIIAWCGGSLIATNWVLTAAHCTMNMNYITVYFGDAKRLSGESQKITRSKGCKLKDSDPTMCNVIEHRGFSSFTLRNDIALIKIPCVKTSKNVWFVKLPPSSSNYRTYEYEKGITSGWGRMGDDSISEATNLQYAINKVISNTECKRTYGEGVTDGNICLNTNYSEGVRSICLGDSGGPLVTSEKNHRERTQIGVASFSHRAECTLGFPAAFTRVTYYLDWINELISKMNKL